MAQGIGPNYAKTLAQDIHWWRGSRSADCVVLRKESNPLQWALRAMNESAMAEAPLT